MSEKGGGDIRGMGLVMTFRNLKLFFRLQFLFKLDNAKAPYSVHLYGNDSIYCF